MGTTAGIAGSAASAPPSRNKTPLPAPDIQPTAVVWRGKVKKKPFCSLTEHSKHGHNQGMKTRSKGEALLLQLPGKPLLQLMHEIETCPRFGD